MVLSVKTFELSVGFTVDQVITLFPMAIVLSLFRKHQLAVLTFQNSLPFCATFHLLRSNFNTVFTVITAQCKFVFRCHYFLRTFLFVTFHCQKLQWPVWLINLNFLVGRPGSFGACMMHNPQKAQLDCCLNSVFQVVLLESTARPLLNRRSSGAPPGIFA